MSTACEHLALESQSAQVSALRTIFQTRLHLCEAYVSNLRSKVSMLMKSTQHNEEDTIADDNNDVDDDDQTNKTLTRTKLSMNTSDLSPSTRQHEIRLPLPPMTKSNMVA